MRTAAREHVATVHKARSAAYKERRGEDRDAATCESKASSAHVSTPAALADRQLTLDRERTKRFPDLFVRKLQRMSASPLAFLRGAAPLFYEILAGAPRARRGPRR